jgi:hypothetical protein
MDQILELFAYQMRIQNIIHVMRILANFFNP